MSTLGDAVLENQLNNVNKNLKPSVLYTKLELTHGQLEWIPVVNMADGNLGVKGKEALAEIARDGTACVSGAWSVQKDGSVQLTLRSDTGHNPETIAQKMRNNMDADGAEHIDRATVDFRNLTHFVENVPLYTREQMNVQRKIPSNTTSIPKDVSTSTPPQNTSPSTVVFYDSPCIDGACAAWAIKQFFKDRPSAKVKYVPLGWGKPGERTQKILGNTNDGDKVIFVDTSPKDDTLRLLANPALGEREDQPIKIPKIQALTVIDHHESEVKRLRAFKVAQDAMDEQHDGPRNKPSLNFILRPDKPSAALLAWEHFHPDEPAPRLFHWIGKMEPPVQLANDNDFAIAAFIDAKNISTPEKAFTTIDNLEHLSEQQATILGKPIRIEQTNNIRKYLKNSVMVTELELLPGAHALVPIVNANVQNFGRSVNKELLGELAENTYPKPGIAGVCGAWYVQGDGTVKLSLRSNGVPNVGEMAKHLGGTIGKDGGGHTTDAVVIFDNLIDFAKAVPLYTKEQKSARGGGGDSPHAALIRRSATAGAAHGFT